MSIALRGFFLDMALSIFQTLAENRILNTAQSGAYYTTVNLKGNTVFEARETWITVSDLSVTYSVSLG